MKRKIILFTKAPRLGYGKSRLRDFLNEKDRLELCRKLINNMISILTKTGIEVVVYYSGDKKDLEFISLLKKEQQGSSLGERMHHAIREELLSSEQVILLGSDIYNIDRELILEAFETLVTDDVCIAPTIDGGYGLIGMKKAYDLYSGITYGVATVFRHTMEKNSERNLSVSILRTLSDIDTKKDLIQAEIGSKDVKLLGCGEYNMNYLVNQSYVFRINISSQLHLGKEQIFYEYQALRVLEDSGVTPKVYSYQKEGKFMPYGNLTMQYLKGRPLNYDTDLKIAASLLSTIHNYDYSHKKISLIYAKEPFQTMYEEFLQMFRIYQEWENRDLVTEKRILGMIIMAEKSGLDKKIERDCIINTELNSGNFIIAENSYVIDWEKPLIGECEQDLAHFLVPTTTNWKTEKILTVEEINKFLKEYEKHRAVDRIKLKKYMMFNCLRGITWCSMAKVEYENHRSLSNIETYKKINKFLGNEFLDMIEERYFGDYK